MSGFEELELLPVRRRAPWGSLAGSVALHTLVVALVVGILHREPPAESAGRQHAPPPVVEMVYLPPAPTPPRAAPQSVVPEPRPVPPQTRRSLETPPRPRVPEHDLPDAPVPAPREQRIPLPSAAPKAPAPPEHRAEEPAGEAASKATALESEARRLFGRRPHGGQAMVGPLAAAGMPVYVPDNPNRCGPKERPPRDPNARPELGSVRGRVFRQGTRDPLPGAFLQIVGTGYNTFADDRGYYTLAFDKSLVDDCRTQMVRVTAPGFRAQILELSLGPQQSNDIPMARR